MSTPVTKHSSWRYLLRELTGKPQYRALASLTAQSLEMGLAMPATIARWIALFQPKLREQASLHVIVAGAEWGPDCVDEGRWYQMIPVLLGVPDMAVKVTLVGPNCNISTRAGAPPGLKPLSASASASKGWQPAAKFVGTLGDFVRYAGLTNVSLVLLSHPGLDTHAGRWLGAGELDAVLGTGVPVGLLHYSEAELEHESYIIDTYGYSLLPHFDRNPFALQTPGASLDSAQGAILSEMSAYLPADTFRPDPSRELLLADYELWTRTLNGEGYLVMDNERGGIANVPGLGEVVLVPKHLGIHLATGQAYVEQDNGRLALAQGLILPAEILREYPRKPRLPFERALWVMKASQHLMGRVGPTSG